MFGPIIENAWLGREDSNLRMVESKSTALPLGDAPTPGLRQTALAGGRTIKRGWPSRNCLSAFSRARGKDLGNQQVARASTPTCSAHAGLNSRNLGRGARLPLLPPAGASIRPALRAEPRRCRSVAQSGSAPRSGRGGRRFESYHSDQFKPRKLDPDARSPRGNRVALMWGLLFHAPYSRGGAHCRLASFSRRIADRRGNSSAICERPKREACSRPKSAMRYRPHRSSNCSGFRSRK